MKTFKFLIILFAAISCIAASAQKSLVVAHRGYWKTSGATSAATATESAQNSIRSLCKADSIHCWGSEFDLWMSADGVLFINHDATISNLLNPAKRVHKLIDRHIQNTAEKSNS